jgi:tRNA (guanine37-N1)-methyltransferase
VLGNEDSAPNDSFEAGLLEHPHYTRPAQSELGEVPAVLLNGDHGAIALWRRQQSLANTLKKRPDLLATATLDKKDKEYLEALGWERPIKKKEGV